MPVSSSDRIKLIHKGNALYNSGSYLLAERLFRAANYQDGLIRTGQHYYTKKEFLRAADIFRSAKYLKGEYACYAKMGLIKDLIDFNDGIQKKRMDDEINKKLARAVRKMLYS